VALPLLNAGQHRGKKSKEEMRVMKIKTQVKVGAIATNHNETLRVRTAVKAGFGKIATNHNEALRVRTSVKAGFGKLATNHNEALQVRTGLQGGKLRKQIVTTSPKEDRLTLLVVRAGLRAGLRGRR
jgi:hypothetical protein